VRGADHDDLGLSHPSKLGERLCDSFFGVYSIAQSEPLSREVGQRAQRTHARAPRVRRGLRAAKGYDHRLGLQTLGWLRAVRALDGDTLVRDMDRVGFEPTDEAAPRMRGQRLLELRFHSREVRADHGQRGPLLAQRLERDALRAAAQPGEACVGIADLGRLEKGRAKGVRVENES
jgi:hypothetical protein